MLVKRIPDCREFEANDGTLLREVLHPKNEDIAFKCSIAHARVPARGKSVPHVLGARAEAYIFLMGKGIMHIGGESAEVEEGCVACVPPGAVQWVENTGNSDLAFLCVVDPAWSAEDDRRA